MFYFCAINKTTMTKKVIKLDIDGCVRDTVQALCDVFEMTTGIHRTTEEVTSYKVSESFPEIKKLIENGDIKYCKNVDEFFFKKHSYDCFRKSKVKGDVRKSINEIKDLGFKIALCTYQPYPISIKHTVDFLTENEIYYDELHFTKDKWRISGDYIIDDAPMFLTDVREQAKKLCIDYPYNRTDSRFSFDKNNRFKTVESAIKYIKKIETV